MTALVNPVKNRRKELSLSQLELAGKTGVLASSISRYETASQTMSFKNAEALSKEFKINPHQLLQEQKEFISIYKGKNIKEITTFSLQKIREKLGLSIEDVASKIGIEPNIYELYENKKWRIPENLISILANTLNISYKDISDNYIISKVSNKTSSFFQKNKQTMSIFQERFLSRRKHLNLSLEDLSAKTDIPLSDLERIENTKIGHHISLDFLTKISISLNVTIDYLIGREDFIDPEYPDLDINPKYGQMLNNIKDFSDEQKESLYKVYEHIKEEKDSHEKKGFFKNIFSKRNVA